MLKPDRHRYSYYTSSFWLDATQQNTTGEAFSTTIDFRNASRTKKQNEQKHDERTQHKFTTTTFSNNSTTLINHPRPGCCRFLLFERSINGKNLSEFSLPRAFKSPSSYFEMHPPPLRWWVCGSAIYDASTATRKMNHYNVTKSITPPEQAATPPPPPALAEAKG